MLTFKLLDDRKHLMRFASVPTYETESEQLPTKIYITTNMINSFGCGRFVSMASLYS